MALKSRGSYLVFTFENHSKLYINGNLEVDKKATVRIIALLNVEFETIKESTHVKI